jgi:hypothetical protein
MVVGLGTFTPGLSPLVDASTAVQLKVVPATLEDTGIDVALPEQIVCVEDAPITWGLGLTLT